MLPFVDFFALAVREEDNFEKHCSIMSYRANYLKS